MTIDPGIVQIALAVIGAVVSVQLAKITAQGTRAAEKVDEVKTTLETTSEVNTHKLDEIHTLVNGAMSSQMLISTVALRRVADLSKHADDIAAAELAEKTYRDHMSKQPGQA